MNKLRRINSLKELSLRERAIEDAVKAFVEDSHTEETGADKVGLYNQTIENIAACTLFQHSDAQGFWVADDGGEVMAYALTHVSKDVDNRLCFWITQAWAHPVLRGTSIVKEWFQDLRNEAKNNLCKHIIIPSSRGEKAYCRFLGKNWKPYVSLLKEDI